VLAGCTVSHYTAKPSTSRSPGSTAPKASTAQRPDYSPAQSAPPCPVQIPRVPTTRSSIEGLANSLVPFVATGVRVCGYWLDSQGATRLHTITSEGGTASVVTSLEDEMNTFATVPQSGQARECPPTSPPLLFVTFYRSSTSVDVREAGGCGWMTNGLLVANPTPMWRSGMALWTACEGCRSTGPTTASG
jgi:hypothetical protein